MKSKNRITPLLPIAPCWDIFSLVDCSTSLSSSTPYTLDWLLLEHTGKGKFTFNTYFIGQLFCPVREKVRSMLGKQASKTGNKYHALSEGRDCNLEQIMPNLW